MILLRTEHRTWASYNKYWDSMILWDTFSVLCSLIYSGKEEGMDISEYLQQSTRCAGHWPLCTLACVKFEVVVSTL